MSNSVFVPSLHSNFYGGLRETHLFCKNAYIGRWRSSKIINFLLLIESAHATSC